MKFTILQENFKKGLSVIDRISAKSLTLPILNNILIKAEKNFISLTSTDLEIGIRWWGLIKKEKEGAIAIPSKVFSNFLNYLPNKPVGLEEKNLVLTVNCENYKTQFKGQSADEFPVFPQITEDKSIILDSKSFCQGLSQVVDVASLSTVKPEISGIYFIFQKDLIKVVATDSFRLAEKTISLKSPIQISQEHSLILPQKTCREIINIFGEKKENIKLYFSPNQVLFESVMEETSHPEIQMISRLIEGEYPNYQEIIPKKYKTQIVSPKNEFLNQIKIASLFSGKVNEVKMRIDPKKNQIEFSSQNPDFGEHHSVFSAKIKGEPLDVSFNPKFLIDGFSNIKSAEVIFELTGMEQPAVLKPAGDQSYLYIVMPISLKYKSERE